MNTIRRAIEDEGRRQGDRILSRLLDESHRVAGWQMTMASYAVGAAGVVVALATIFAAIVGFLGVTEIRRSADEVERLRHEAEEHAEAARQSSETVEQTLHGLLQMMGSLGAEPNRRRGVDPARDDRRPSGSD